MVNFNYSDTKTAFIPLHQSDKHFFEYFCRYSNMIIDNLPEYDFYLDTYSFERWETILYGVPRELGPRTTNVV